MVLDTLHAARSFRFTVEPKVSKGEAVGASLDLTASDGTGLELVSFTARIVVEDPLAFTELRLVFRNPEARQLEGRFRVALPGGASVSRFAMRIGGAWQEGEVVERQAARRAYEDFLHRRQDPALLEHEAGNEFSARVFPIEARAEKELIISYSHELVRADSPYTLPLRGLPRLDRLDVRALVGRADGGKISSSLGGTSTRFEVLEVQKRSWTPDTDFEIRPPPSRRAGLRQGNLVVARVAPELPVEPEEIASLLILVDTSASRALGHAQEVDLVRDLVEGLAAGAGPDVPVLLACFDQGVEPMFEGTARDLLGAPLSRLRGRFALGASDLEKALRWIGGRRGRTYARVLILTDGVLTAGATEPDRLIEAAKSIARAGVERLDAIAVGGLKDDATLRRLVTAGLPRDGTVCDGGAPLQEIAKRLTRATRSGIKVEVSGAAWSWPARLDGVQPGDAVLVYADLPERTPFEVRLDGRPVKELGLLEAERLLLERAWVKARIEKLEDQRARLDADADVREALKRQVLELSVRHRVLCPYTALLVLETEADYARFHIDRRALADILTVGAGGVEVLHRASPGAAPAVAPLPPMPMQAMKADSFGAGGDDAPSSQSAPDEDHGAVVDELELSALESAPEAEEATGSLAMPDLAETGKTPRQDLDEAPAPRAAPPPMSAAPKPVRAVRAFEAPPPRPAPVRASVAAPSPMPIPGSVPGPQAPGAIPGADAWTGPFREVMELLGAGRAKEALDRALAWRAGSPGDVLALVAVGMAAEALDDFDLAARAFGSLIDLFPSRADVRRFAGELLEKLPYAMVSDLVIDTFRRAVEERPDHPSSHRLLGLALLRAGRPSEAFEAFAVGRARDYPPRFPGVDRILSEDIGLAAAAWIRREPSRKEEILAKLADAHGTVESGPSVRFVLFWETDANDVDFHIHDGRGGHAFYSQKELPSGGELYADITEGYGPECFTIRAAPKSRSYPYRLQAHYFRRGPMGYGMGTLQTLEHDGEGRFGYAARPYVVMQDHAYVDLGVAGGPLPIEEQEGS